MYKRCEIFFTELMSISTLMKGPEYVLNAFLHSHEEYEFVVPHTSVPFLVNEDAVYFGEVGYVFSVQSGRSHGIKYSLADVSCSDIVIRKEYFDKIMQQKGVLGAQFNCEFPLSSDLKFLLDAFKREFRKGPQSDPHKLEILGELMCIELISTGVNPNLDRRKNKQSYQRGMQAAAQFINENFNQNFTVSELAAIGGFSENYFMKMFKNAVGESPHSYLSKLRISHAKLLLETTDDSIHQISEKCGFKKANSFTSQFKASTGMTPKEYRKLHE